MAAIEVHRVARPKRHNRANVPAAHRLILRPIVTDRNQTVEAIDVTAGIVRAVAHELWQHNRGNETLNWLEAERLVQHLLDLAWASQSRPAARLPHQEIEVTPDSRQQPASQPLPIEERRLSLAA